MPAAGGAGERRVQPRLGGLLLAFGDALLG